MSYLKEVIFAAIICGILTRLPPGGKSAKYVKYIASLAFLCVLSAPVIDAVENIPDFIDGLTDIGNLGGSEEKAELNGNLEILSSEICKAAVKNAAEEFNVKEEELSLKLIIDEKDSGEISLREVTVYPTGDVAKIAESALKSYFEKILECPAEVVTDG